MQTNRLRYIQYPAVTDSEKKLMIFYRKSKTARAVERTNGIRLRMLKKFSIHTEEEMTSFEEAFEITYPGYITRLKQQCGELTQTERVILIFFRINLTEKHIAHNLGYSIEAVKRSIFIIRRKLQVDPAQLTAIVHAV